MRDNCEECGTFDYLNDDGICRHCEQEELDREYEESLSEDDDEE